MKLEQIVARKGIGLLGSLDSHALGVDGGRVLAPNLVGNVVSDLATLKT